VSERPILMSTEMVRAILEGRKTQTRRVMKPQPTINAERAELNEFGRWDFYGHGQVECAFVCPYGQPGDVLYVKESHKLTRYDDVFGSFIKCEYKHEVDNDGGIRWFRWSVIPEKQRERLRKIKIWGKWRPSRCMYKFLARITREIVSVRAERLQEITLEDCWDEGFQGRAETRIPSFKKFWDSLNAKRGYSWESNLWVWPIGWAPLK